MSHLLVTNDFPPKVGGIQRYLWELWRRLDPSTFAVLTTASHPQADAFDRAQRARGLQIERVRAPLLLPTPKLVRRIRALARDRQARLVVLDPAVPLGLVGPHLGIPYAVVLHGAEVAVPGRLPVGRQLLRRAAGRAALAVAAGGYPAAELARALRGRAGPPVVQVPPGVDLDRFRPLDDSERRAARDRFGLPSGPLVVSVSRLVPRKGMDVLVDAAVRLRPRLPGLTVAIAGRGRDHDRLAGRIAEHDAPVRLLGGLDDDDLPRLVGTADVFAMLCRDRWLGLEREGFGMVFLEAAACGVPQVAGRSGGSAEAVVDGETGIVLRRPTDAGAAADALGRLLCDRALGARMGAAGRARAEASFDDDKLAPRLAAALAAVGG
ncbi:MAG TPA: glycosyltransferase family 4 protein [Acidimicrobiales bacterium]|nr:glycosyltransferase family 4 protein [Acidimicrobiales bacterium]